MHNPLYMFNKATSQNVSGFGCIKKYIYESETLNSAKLTRLKEQTGFFILFGLRLKDSILTYICSF